MPTRERPEKALHLLALYQMMAGCPVTLEVVIDTDDRTWTRDHTDRAATLGVFVASGNHASKIEACNGGLFQGWDVLLLASDDMVPVKDGYGARILSLMREHFPLLDGALHFHDGYAGSKLCTLPILGRRLYDQFGYVYFPGYRSFFCDNEQTDVLRDMKRLMFIDEKIIEHRHPGNDRALHSDALYRRNNKPWNHDHDLYYKRAARNFDQPVCKLSVLIATLPRRARLLDTLTEKLWDQAVRYPRQVEIIVDSGEGTTGAKRQRLLKKARGQFIAFVDDDDEVSESYVDEILRALEREPDADCVELYVKMQNGFLSSVGHCSIRYQEWRRSPSGVYERCPNHLSPVRRALALAVGFPDKTIYEDREYSMRLRPLLEKEARALSDKPLYFYFPGRGA